MTTPEGRNAPGPAVLARGVMRTARIVAGAAACCLLSCGADGMPPTGPTPADSLVAFVGANLLTMQSPEVLPDQTVVVRAGTIVTVGPRAEVPVPAGARRIDVAGAYLMPGLTDFHVHIGARSDLLGYVAAGVTTAVNMGGNGPAIIAWRDSARAGTLIGPDVFVGAYVNGPLNVGGPATVQTSDEARAAVASAARNGFDFIKVYNSLTAEQFDAIINEANQHHLPVMGHAVRSVGLARGFARGQRLVAHAEEYMYADLRGQTDSLVPDAVTFTRQYGAALVANLSAFHTIEVQWGRPEVVDSFLALPEARYLPEYWVRRWRSADYVHRQGTLSALPFLERLTLAMRRGGVTLLLGTDSPSIPGMFPGASIHEELRLLVESGLTPFEALTAGTGAAGAFAGQVFRAERFGLIAPGYRADLVLLAGNPLEDVRRAAAPLGVMVRGRWLPRSELAALRAGAR